MSESFQFLLTALFVLFSQINDDSFFCTCCGKRAKRRYCIGGVPIAAAICLHKGFVNHLNGPFPLPACESCSAASKAVTRILCLGFPEVQAFMPETFKGRIPHQTQVNPTMIISLIVLLPPVTSSPEFGDCDDLPLSCDKRETSHPDPPTTLISNRLKLQRVLTFSSVSHSMRKQNTS